MPFRPSPLPPAFHTKYYPRRIVRQWPRSPRRASSQHRVPCRRQIFLTETAGVGVFTSFVGFSRVRGSRFPSIPPGVSCPGCDWTSGRRGWRTPKSAPAPGTPGKSRGPRTSYGEIPLPKQTNKKTEGRGGRRIRKCLAEPASRVRRGPSEESVKHETPFTSRTRFGRCATSNQIWSRVLSNSSSESSCRIHIKPACRHVQPSFGPPSTFPCVYSYLYTPYSYKLFDFCSSPP